jgi:hypothetical protein
MSTAWQPFYHGRTLQTLVNLEGLLIPDPDALQGWIAYVVDVPAPVGGPAYYSLSLVSGSPVDPVNVRPTILGGASRWLRLPFGSGFPIGGTNKLIDLSVNTAAVDGGFSDGSIVMRTGAVANPVGAYTGGGTGNKSIAAVPNTGLVGQPISAISSIEVAWQNLVGPGANTVLTPKANFVVDFSPDPAGIRMILAMDDSLLPVISAAIGTYTGIPGPFPVGPNYNYKWNATLPANAGGSVLIVGIPGPLGPGGVPPSVSAVGAPFWQYNAFSWTALAAANPNAKLVEVFPADGGMPAGAMVPPVALISGDSGNMIKSGKKILQFFLNGNPIIP